MTTVTYLEFGLTAALVVLSWVLIDSASYRRGLRHANRQAEIDQAEAMAVLRLENQTLREKCRLYKEEAEILRVACEDTIR